MDPSVWARKLINVMALLESDSYSCAQMAKWLMNGAKIQKTMFWVDIRIIHDHWRDCNACSDDPIDKIKNLTFWCVWYFQESWQNMYNQIYLMKARIGPQLVFDTDLSDPTLASPNIARRCASFLKRTSKTNCVAWSVGPNSELLAWYPYNT